MGRVTGGGAFDRVVAQLRRGEVVACPTETLVGLLADALDPDAVARVVALKGRTSDAPIAVLLPDAASLPQVAEPPAPAVRALLARAWPGPLTAVLTARPGLPPGIVRDGKVGCRVPGPSPAFDLVRAFGGPLTATSANVSGEPPVRSGEEALLRFFDKLAGAVEGEAPGGAPSTVVDFTVVPPRVIRQGAVRLAEVPELGEPSPPRRSKAPTGDGGTSA